MESAFSTTFLFLARRAIEAIPQDEVDQNSGAIKAILDVYRLSDKLITEQETLIKLHDHVDIIQFGFDADELTVIAYNVDQHQAKKKAIDPSSSSHNNDESNAGNDDAEEPRSSSSSDDDDNDDNDDDSSPPMTGVFPPGLVKGFDVDKEHGNMGAMCELCGHIMRLKDLPFHAHEGRGVKLFRVVRAIAAEGVWWAKDARGNEYTGALRPLPESFGRGRIPNPCGDRMRATRREQMKRRRDARK